MARYPKAVWRPITGHTDGPFPDGEPRGAVLHVNESNGNLFNWVDGDHNVSCHFEVYKNGSIEQYLDTTMTSWCQMDGNASYVSIETEGFHTEPFTAEQTHAIAELLAWLHKTHGIRLEPIEHPGAHGIGWHGMGGEAWGGHTDCPGDHRKAARANICATARMIVAGKTPTPPVKTPAPSTPKPHPPAQYPVTLVTEAGNKKAPVLALGYGRTVRASHPLVETLLMHGLSDGVIHEVTPRRLKALRSMFGGK